VDLLVSQLHHRGDTEGLFIVLAEQIEDLVFAAKEEGRRREEGGGRRGGRRKEEGGERREERREGRCTLSITWILFNSCFSTGTQAVNTSLSVTGM
jgi:hypothetical protein